MKHAFKDISIIILSIVIAFLIAELNGIEKVIAFSEKIRLLGSFMGGLLFTSVFTTAPAIVVLGEISQTESLFLVALLGGVGAVIGDLLIFRIFKDHVTHDISLVMGKGNILKNLYRYRVLRWSSIFLGALIIASPLPDELGVAMMGLVKLRMSVFIPISFSFNFLGILLIGLASRAIS